MVIVNAYKMKQFINCVAFIAVFCSIVNVSVIGKRIPSSPSFSLTDGNIDDNKNGRNDDQSNFKT